METQNIKQSLELLTRDLLYSSESDYPLQVLDWSDQTQEFSKVISARHGGSTPVPFDPHDFFKRYIQRQEASGDQVMKQDAARYRALYEYLNSHSKKLEGWRCGLVQVGIYIIITCPDGKILVIHTTSVET